MFESIVPSDTLSALRDTARDAPPGCFVEVGVYRGGTALHLHEIADRQLRQLHLFDTFSGMPYQGSDDKHAVGDFADTSLEVLRQGLPRAIFHVGVFPDTMPADLRDISFAHIDCDQHDGVAACITQLFPLLVPGGVMWFDDYELAGARRAIDRAFLKEELVAAPAGRVYVRKR